MISGIFVIDKPAGITSHDVVNRVRRILKTRKVGHTGTLDPFATGVLPVAVNDGTKVIPFLDEGVKCYDALLRLGVVTDTLDVTGNVVCQADISSVTIERTMSILTRFVGRINQIPPMFSAIKQGGQPLYKLARQGIEVERKSRLVDIYSLEMLSFVPPLVGIRVVCSRGTYIRALAGDIGDALGCGATLQELRREASGYFNISAAISLEVLEMYQNHEQLETVCLKPCTTLGHLPDIPLAESGYVKVMHGRAPDCSDTMLADLPLGELGTLVKLSFKGELCAVAQFVYGSGKLLNLKRVFAK